MFTKITIIYKKNKKIEENYDKRNMYSQIFLL